MARGACRQNSARQGGTKPRLPLRQNPARQGKAQIHQREHSIHKGIGVPHSGHTPLVLPVHV
jgi:hypothetical protein